MTPDSGARGQPRSGTRSRKFKIAAICLAYAALACVEGYSTVNRVELFPISAFSMFSYRFTGPVDMSNLQFILRDGSRIPLTWIDTYDESRLSVLVDTAYWYDSGESAFSHASETLRAVLSRCLSKPDCWMASRDRRVFADEVAGIRAVNNHYERVTYQSFMHPDKTVELAKALR